MPFQRTFELVPTTLVTSVGYKPPMTSKQVKREHQKANRVKGISIAEQRLLESEEIARQKKDYQREKTLMRNKAIKEKKAAKALAEREERKRAGLPEPNRLVRASQPPISKFVKPLKAGKRNWCMMDGNIEGSIGSDRDESRMEAKDTPEPPAKRTVANSDSEDEFGDFPSCTQIEMIASSIDCLHDKASSLAKLDPKILPSVSPHPSESSKRREIMENCTAQISKVPVGVIALELPSEVFETTSKSQSHEQENQQECDQLIKLPPEFLAPSRLLSSQNTLEDCDSSSDKPDLMEIGNPLRNELTNLSQNVYNMKITIGKMKSIVSEERFSSTTNLSDNVSGSANSASKLEAQKVLDDIDDYEFPSNTQVMVEISSPRTVYQDQGSTNSRFTNHNSPIQSNPTSTKLPTRASLETPKFINVYPEYKIDEPGDTFDDLICTQDLLVLSQEICDVMRPICKPELPAESPVQAQIRGRFFEEKEEDLIQAAIYESKMMMNTRKIEEDEDETKPTSPPDLKLELSQIDTSREQSTRCLSIDNLPISIQVPTKIPGEKPQIIEVSTEAPLTCTLSRVSSPSTDYGDDELDGKDWEEITALC